MLTAVILLIVICAVGRSMLENSYEGAVNESIDRRCSANPSGTSYILNALLQLRSLEEIRSNDLLTAAQKVSALNRARTRMAPTPPVVNDRIDMLCKKYQALVDHAKGGQADGDIR